MSISQKTLISTLETLAPPALAEDWDNTGLLLDSDPARSVTNILLTIDLTPPVLAEALNAKVDFIIAYHPPIFSGLKRLVTTEPRNATLLACIRQGIPVYSPHTALDAAEGGVSDWLASAFDYTDMQPIHDEGVGGGTGPGRYLQLKKARSLASIRKTLTSHTGIPYLREARPAGPAPTIKTIALCPGAGASLLSGINADLILTGEMRHHDAIAFAEAGTTVLISEHSHTERGYLPVFAKRLRRLLGKRVTVRCAKHDRDPFQLQLPTKNA